MSTDCQLTDVTQATLSGSLESVVKHITAITAFCQRLHQTGKTDINGLL